MVITKVYPGYAAERAGLQAGDVVVHWGDRGIFTCDDLQAGVRGAPPGAKRRIGFHRGGDYRSVELIVNPVDNQTAQGAKPAAPQPSLGLRATTAGRPEAVAVGVESPSGAVIVWPDTPGAAAGLRRGDLIVQFGDREIRNLEDAESALRHSPIGSRQRLVIVRGVQRLAIEARIGSRVPTEAPGWYTHGEGRYRLRLAPELSGRHKACQAGRCRRGFAGALAGAW